MRTLLLRANAFRLGYFDGIAQPDELTTGMTWQDSTLNRVYDEGVSIGQVAGAFLRGVVALIPLVFFLFVAMLMLATIRVFIP
jgi:hypothetical protein